MIRETGENSLEKINPDELVEMMSVFSPQSKERVTQLKYHFRAILDSVLCSPEKMLIFVSQNLSNKTTKEYENVGI